VLPALPLDGEFLSSHWNIVLGVGLAFLLWQLVLSLRVYLRARRDERILKGLRVEFAHGGSGRGERRALPRSFTWLKWVTSLFPEGARSAPGNFTRDDVLQELDSRLASNPSYLLLQRLGVMAPLLGVVLTVVGFYWLDIDESAEQSLPTILLAVTPLVSGVGAGAVLALVNQLLLHVTGNRIERMRVAARNWFDEVIWSNMSVPTQAATVKAVTAIERYAGTVAEAAARHAAASDRMDETTETMKSAAMRFHRIAETFGAGLREMPATFGQLRASLAASAHALEDLIPMGSRAIANLDVCVAAFRSTIEREFAGAAQLQYGSSRALADSIQHIVESTSLLKAGSVELNETAQASAASFRILDESLRERVLPGQTRFSDAVDSLTGQLAPFTSAVGALSTNVSALAAELDRTAAELVPSVSNFCQAVDGAFGPAVSEHRRQVDSASEAVGQLQDAAQTLAQGASAVTAMLHESTGAVEQAGRAQQILADASAGLVDAGSRLRQTVEADAAPAQQAMRAAADSMAASVRRMAELIDSGFAPAAHELQSLHQALMGIERTVGAIQDFSHARADIDRLTEALARAADVADAISALPEQVRDVLEQSADHNAALAGARSGFRMWLGGRPR
jgi:hypothetical protein